MGGTLVFIYSPPQLPCKGRPTVGWFLWEKKFFCWIVLVYAKGCCSDTLRNRAVPHPDIKKEATYIGNLNISYDNHLLISAVD